MARLSVNVNKVATLRNSRGGTEPSVIAATQACVDAGAPGITVHPRDDERHIRPADVYEVAKLLAPMREHVEYNIEGDPRPDWVEMVEAVRPHQCTLVPVRPGELTSEAGWPADTPVEELKELVSRFHGAGVRVSVFVDPIPAPIEWAASSGPTALSFTPSHTPVPSNGAERRSNRHSSRIGPRRNTQPNAG